jgi:hypothetical protein
LPIGDGRVSDAEIAGSHYKVFLTLIIRHPRESIVPLGDIDAFWHQHILDTRKYASDRELIFGRFFIITPILGCAALNSRSPWMVGIRLP